MKLKISFIFFLFISISFSQEYIVESAELPEAIFNSTVEIPRLTSSLEENKRVVDNINHQILQQFFIDSYNQDEIDEFRWSSVEYNSELNDSILYLHYEGEYNGPYTSYVGDEMYFDLRTGKRLTKFEVPFQTLFSLSGYLDVLNKYWLTDVKKEFDSARECSDDEPNCTYYDIQNFSTHNNQLVIALTNDCFEHYRRYCSPSYSVSIDLDSIKQYLSKLGKHILIETNYMSASPIEQFLESQNFRKMIESHLYIFGKIDGKYPVSIALNTDDKGQISGYYYYDKNHKNITLTGKHKNALKEIIETYNNKVTGRFDFSVSNGYDPEAFHFFDKISGENIYMRGKWTNPEKTKAYEIEIYAVKVTYFKNH